MLPDDMCFPNLAFFLPLENFILGCEEGRTGGWPAADPSYHRMSGPAVSAGSLSKQKSPAANESASKKEATVSG